MKYLLVLVVIVMAVGIWRNKRRDEVAERKTAGTRPAPALKQPQNMVACAHCGLHLPQADAVTDGENQYYCSAEHRSLAQRSRH